MPRTMVVHCIGFDVREQRTAREVAFGPCLRRVLAMCNLRISWGSMHAAACQNAPRQPNLQTHRMGDRMMSAVAVASVKTVSVCVQGNNRPMLMKEDLEDEDLSTDAIDKLYRRHRRTGDKHYSREAKRQRLLSLLEVCSWLLQSTLGQACRAACVDASSPVGASVRVRQALLHRCQCASEFVISTNTVTDRRTAPWMLWDPLW